MCNYIFNARRNNNNCIVECDLILYTGQKVIKEYLVQINVITTPTLNNLKYDPCYTFSYIFQLKFLVRSCMVNRYIHKYTLLYKYEYKV